MQGRTQFGWGAFAAVAGAAVLCVGGLGPLGGCSLKPGSKSILDLWTPTSPEEAAKWAIDKYDADKRYRGTLLLANAYFASEPVYIQLFKDNIKDEDPGVRGAAVRGLANHGTPEDAVLIVARLNDEDASVRQEAARGLQRVYNVVAIAPLMDSLDPEKERDVAVRSEAATALGMYRQPRVIEKLITTLDDENLSINRTTRNSLTTLTGQDFGYDRGNWARWNKDEKQTFVAGSIYMYPVFYRDKKWYEYLPFVPPPPNEVSSTPAGMPLTAP